MKLKPYLLISVMVFNLSGCMFLKKQQVETPRVTVSEGQTIELPTPEQLNLNLTATQIVSAGYVIKGETKNYTSEVHVLVTPEKIVMLAVSGWGGQLFSVTYTGHTITSSSLPMPNANMGVEHTLTDFIFTYATPELLSSVLSSTRIKLVLKPNQRIFLIDNQPMMQIDYQNSDPWQGKVVVHNYELNYTVTIETIELKTHVR